MAEEGAAAEYPEIEVRPTLQVTVPREDSLSVRTTLRGNAIKRLQKAITGPTVKQKLRMRGIFMPVVTLPRQPAKKARQRRRGPPKRKADHAPPPTHYVSDIYTDNAAAAATEARRRQWGATT